jgi:hypothetical protein
MTERFEYMKAAANRLDYDTISEFNYYGERGWELVHIQQHPIPTDQYASKTPTATALFRRRMEPPSQGASND